MKRREFVQSLSSLGMIHVLGSLTMADDGAVERITLADRESASKVAKLEFLRLTGKSGQKSIYLEATTEARVKGLYGPIDAEAFLMADRFMKHEVVGRSALETEAIRDRLDRKSRHSRGSDYLTGMSAIDKVLWDLKAPSTQRHPGR